MGTRHQADFVAWTREQADQLRMTRPAGVDWQNLADEVESLGRGDRRAARNLVCSILEQLLRLEWSPADFSRYFWQDEADHARDALADLMTPSLRAELALDFAALYVRARRYAARALERDGVDGSLLPPVSPYSLDQLCDRDWFPANRHGLLS